MLTKVKRKKNPLITLGWREYVSFPVWGISKMRCKVDTGARTSALDVSDIEELPGNHVGFKVAVPWGDSARRVHAEAKIVRRSKVKSSMGHKQERYVIEANILLGPIAKRIEISLMSRKNMLCPMLLGRTAIAGLCVVNPNQKYLMGGLRKEKKKKKKKVRKKPRG